MPIQNLDKILKEIQNLDFSELKNISSKIRSFSELKQEQEKSFNRLMNEQKQWNDETIKSIDLTHKKSMEKQEKSFNRLMNEQKQWNEETIKSIDLTHKKSMEKQKKDIKEFFEKQKNDSSNTLNQYLSENTTTINTRIDNLTTLKNNIIEQEQVVNKSFNQLQKRIKQSEKNIESSFSQFLQQQEVWQKNVNSMWENSNKMRANSQNIQEKENFTIHLSIKDLENKTKKDQETLKQHNILFQNKIDKLSKEISTHTLILDAQKKRLIILGIISLSLLGSLFYILLNK